jgi:hypothetical protein
MEQESTLITGMVEEPVDPARRCTSCGGLNPSGAQWCGQCHARFEGPADEPAPERVDAEPQPESPQAPQPPSAPRPAATGEEDTGAFRVTDEGIHWTCSICDTVNDLENSICSVCGSPFAMTVLPPEEKPQRDPNMAALVSLFMPGAGHAYLGLWSQAIARGIVSLWVMMVVAVAALQKDAPASNLVMGVFGLVAVALWGVAAHDAYREARDEAGLVILKGKMFFYMVLGLLLLLVALLMSAMVKAQGA